MEFDKKLQTITQKNICTIKVVKTVQALTKNQEFSVLLFRTTRLQNHGIGTRYEIFFQFKSSERSIKISWFFFFSELGGFGPLLWYKSLFIFLSWTLKKRGHLANILPSWYQWPIFIYFVFITIISVWSHISISYLKINNWIIWYSSEISIENVIFIDKNISEEKSQKDQVVTASKPSKPLLT